jgi:hypothetical protein
MTDITSYNDNGQTQPEGGVAVAHAAVAETGFAAAAADPVSAFADSLRAEITVLEAKQSQMVTARGEVERAQAALADAEAAFQKAYEATVKRGYPEAILTQVGIEPLQQVKPGKARRSSPRRTKPQSQATPPIV